MITCTSQPSATITISERGEVICKTGVEGERRMKIVYIAGAYRSRFGLIGRAWNISRARKIAKMLWSMNIAAVCPHSNSAFMDRCASDSTFLRGDTEILKRCDAIVLMPGFATSEGAQAEYFTAQQHGIPKFYVGFPSFESDIKRWRDMG